jgi:nucleoside-diphosphate-sugar epimerase
MKILITGSSGFLGNALQIELKKRGFLYRCITRQDKSFLKNKLQNEENFFVEDINSHTDWSKPLYNIKCVIHCAARAHIINEKEVDSLAAYRKINVEGTRNLAEQASIAGVKRLVFISSIGVNGPFTGNSTFFSHNDYPVPVDNYAISKLEAEQALKEVSAKTGLEVVIIRPPSIYGPGVKGNFLRLLNLINYGLPLPFGRINNLRSYIGLDNLVDFIICCMEHPKASGQIFLVSDGVDLSTRDLIKKISIIMKKNIFFFPVPIFLLRFLSYIIGKHKDLERLVNSLQIDYSWSTKILGWSPPKSLEHGLIKMTESYLKIKKKEKK